MATVYHMVHYRRFEVLGGNSGGTLESLCRQSLSTTDAVGVDLFQRPNDRIFDLGGETGARIILNRVADLADAIFGEMCLVEQRGLQAILQLQAQKVQLSNLTLAEVYELAERSAPTGSQFIRGLAYWLLIDNHILFVKTQSLTPDHIRDYLDWLLKTCTQADPSFSFRLQAEVDKTLGAGDIGDIKRLRVTSRSAPAIMEIDQTQATPAQRTKVRRLAEKSSFSDEAVRVAKAIFGSAKTESLVESFGPEEQLVADTTFSVRGPRTEASKEKMKELVNEIADSDAKVQVEGKDGKITDGDAILRTRMPFTQPHDGSTLLEFDNVADQLRTVYSRFVEDAKIDA